MNEVKKRALRDTFGRFATEMTAITCCENDGTRSDLDFLCAIYENTGNGHGIYYHGAATGNAHGGYSRVAPDDIPLDRFRDSGERAMMARHISEFRYGTFGIYHGAETRGTVQRASAREPSKQ